MTKYNFHEIEDSGDELRKWLFINLMGCLEPEQLTPPTADIALTVNGVEVDIFEVAEKLWRQIDRIADEKVDAILQEHYYDCIEALEEIKEVIQDRKDAVARLLREGGEVAMEELSSLFQNITEQYSDIKRDGGKVIDAVADVLEDKGYVVVTQDVYNALLSTGRSLKATCREGGDTDADG